MWMAFPTEGSKMQTASSEILEEPSKTESTKLLKERLGEWGLVANSESRESSKISGSLRASGEGNKFSMDSTRTSTESSYESSVPRVSQELKDALSTLQQTFVVSECL